MSDRRVLGFVWLAMTVLSWLVFRDLFRWAFATFDIPNQRYLGSVEGSALVAIAAAGGLAWALWNKKDVYQFCLEAVSEIRQVVWPGKKETRENTVIVVAVSVLMSVVLGAFDLVWAKLTGFILSGGV